MDEDLKRFQSEVKANEEKRNLKLIQKNRSNIQRYNTIRTEINRKSKQYNLPQYFISLSHNKAKLKLEDLNKILLDLNSELCKKKLTEENCFNIQDRTDKVMNDNVLNEKEKNEKVVKMLMKEIRFFLNNPDKYNINDKANLLDFIDNNKILHNIIKDNDFIINNEISTSENLPFGHKQDNSTNKIIIPLKYPQLKTLSKIIMNDGVYLNDLYTMDEELGQEDYGIVSFFNLNRLENIKAKKIEINKNKTGQFFKYLNKTDLDLRKYGIYNKDNIEKNVEHCIINCFRNYDIDQIKFFIGTKQKGIQHFPKKYLKNIGELIKCNIELSSYNLVKEKDFNKTNYIIDKKYKTIKLCLFENHYFLNEELPISTYYINNWEMLDKKYKDNENRFKFTRENRIGNNKNYTFNIVKNLFKNNAFVKDDEILSQNILYLDELRNFKKLPKTFNTVKCDFKPKKKKDKFICYADFESYTTKDNKQELFMSGLSFNDEKVFDNKKVFIFDGNPASIICDMFDKILDYNNDLKTYIYFHNLKFDYNLVKKYLLTIKKIEKCGMLYSVDVIYKSKILTLIDSYKIYPYALHTMPFNLQFNNSKYNISDLIKKEAIPYSFYNEENIKEEYADIDEAIKFIKNEDKDLFLKLIENYTTKDNKFYHNKYMKDYLINDVLVLKFGIKILREELLDFFDNDDLDVSNYLTISSLTFDYFKTKNCFDGVYYLKDNILRYCMNAVQGGRCCTMDNEKHLIKDDHLVDFDAVSLYPSAIKRLCRETGIPAGKPLIIENLDKFNYIMNNTNYYFIGTFILDTSEVKHQQIPFINYVENNKRIYSNHIPDKHKIQVIDRITLEDWCKFQNIKYEFVEGVYWSEYNNKWGAEIEKLFNERLTAKKEFKNAKQNLIKLMMNSSYGKTLTKINDNETKYIKKENIDTYIKNQYSILMEAKELSFNYEVKLKKLDTKFKNSCHIGCVILSYSKRIMNEVMNTANDNNIKIFYQDTDSMHLFHRDIKKLEKLYYEEYKKQLIGSKMEQFHSDFEMKTSTNCNEEVISDYSIILGKKCYMDRLRILDLETNTIKRSETQYHLRMKGIPNKFLTNLDKIEFEHKDDVDDDDDIETFLYEYLYSGKKITFDLSHDIFNPRFDTKNGVSNNINFKRTIKF